MQSTNSNKELLIDLHSHSSFSDGTLSPEELVNHATENNIEILALTDHDTTSGLLKFKTHAKKSGLKHIGGIEISADCPSPMGTLHILGLNVTENSAQLDKLLLKICSSREERNIKIVNNLQNLGLDIDYQEVKDVKLSTEPIIGRVHIARILMEKGYIKTIREAFDKYMGKGCPAYTDRYRASPKECIEILKSAGCIVILAHPLQLRMTHTKLANFVKELVDFGIDGLEVYASNATEREIFELLTLTERFKLIKTGGSDFHGKNRPEVKMGYYAENSKIPFECIAGLEHIICSA